MDVRRLRARRARNRRPGARRIHDRQRRYWAAAAAVVVFGVGIAVGIALAITAPWITRIFTTDQTVIDYATVAIIVGALFQPIAGYVFLLDGVLIGAGRGRYLAVAGIVNLVVYAPLLWIIAHSSTLTARPSLALAMVWLAYSAVYTGMRALTNGLGARSL